MSFEAEQAAIARRQRIAEQMMAQGQQPLETTEIAGGYIVPVSPLAGIGKIAQQLAGAYISKNADTEKAALDDKKSAIIRALYANNETPTLDKIAETGLASPDVMFALGNDKVKRKEEHDLKLQDVQMNQAFIDEQRRIAAAERSAERAADREARFQQQQDMARLAASLRPAPQPHQDPLVQVAGQDGQPQYMPSSQAVGQRPFTAQTLKQEQAEAAKEQQRQQASLSAQQVLDQAAILHAHPGRSAGTGASSFLSKIPGTAAKDFQANLDTFKAQTFIPMVSALKGMGALSDAEGKKLSESVGALDPSMSEEAFAKSLKDVTNYLHQKAVVGGLSVTLPEFAAGKVNIDIQHPESLTPEEIKQLAADIKQESGGTLSPAEQEELNRLRARFGK